MKKFLARSVLWKTVCSPQSQWLWVLTGWRNLRHYELRLYEEMAFIVRFNKEFDWMTKRVVPSRNCEERLLVLSCMSVHPSAWNNSASTGLIYDICLLIFHESFHKIEVYWNLTRIRVIVCFLTGNSPASEFYTPTFRNPLSVLSS